MERRERYDEVVVFRLSPKTLAMIDRIAARWGVRRSEVIRRAISLLLEELGLV